MAIASRPRYESFTAEIVRSSAVIFVHVPYENVRVDYFPGKYYDDVEYEIEAVEVKAVTFWNGSVMVLVNRSNATPAQLSWFKALESKLRQSDDWLRAVLED